jgi:anti-sigma factor RsiW
MGLRWHPHQQLLAFVDGGLEPATQTRVAEHLAGCAECRAEAAELARVNDMLRALPAAMRPLTRRPAGSWSQVWGRVNGVPLPLRRAVPQLNLYLSLAAVVFVLAAAVPASLGAQPLPVTAGVIQTPVAAAATPAAGKGTSVATGQLSTALAAKPVTAARPIPIQTPIPGQKG